MTTPPTTAGPYRLLERIGTGGVGAVYRADGPEGEVAVKVLHNARADDTRRLRREFLTLERLDHPNVVHVYDYGEHEARPWLAMELVDGVDLGRLVERWERDPPRDRWVKVEAILRQLCDALEYIHSEHIVHRDLKPGNVLVGRDGKVKLTDFGALKDNDAAHTSLTFAGQLIGTVAFLAPETITAETCDHRADLYSLGAILYVMLTGRRPIIADSIAGYLARHLTEIPRAPSELRPDVPSRLERVCMRLLQKEPSHRPGSARQVVALLEASEATASVHGRDGELAKLQARLELVRGTGEGSTLAVVGRKGSGKRRTLTELMSRAVDLGAVVHEGADAPPDAPLTLWIPPEGDLPAAAPPRTLLVPSLPTALTGVECIELPPLSLVAIRAILRDHGLGGGVGAILARRLADQVPPWPSEVLDQLGALVASGWLERGPDGQLRAAISTDDMRSQPLPLPLRAVAEEAAAMAMMEPEDRVVLESLAVLGQAAPVRLVAAVARLQENEVASGLTALIGEGRVELTTEGLEELYALKDPRRGAAIYESIPPSERAARHHAAAEALLGLYRRRTGALSETVAQHLVKAGRPGDALPLLVQGAWRALRRSDLAGARSLLRRAVQAAEGAREDASTVQRWRRELALARGDMERMAGRHAESEDAFSEALLLAREEGVTEDAGHALAGRGLAALALGRSVEATQLLREATGNLGEGHRVWADAMHGLAWQALEAGELTVARTRWERVNAVARATTQLRAELESDLGLTMIVWAQGGDPVALLQDVSSRARDAGLNDLATRALMADAEVRMERGDAAGALRIAQVLDEVGDRSGFPLADGGARAIRAAALQLAGESDRAREAADEAVATMRLHQSRWLSVWAWSCRVIAATGSAPQGLAELGDRPFAPEPPWPAEPTRLAVQALLMAERNPREAVERARDALRGLSTAPFPGAARRVATDAAQALYRAGEAAEASRVLDEIERTGRRLAQIEQIRRMTES